MYHYWELQVIAYSKGHYGVVNFNYESMVYFAARMYDVLEEDVSKYNINHMLYSLHRKMGLSQSVEDFLEDMFKRKGYTAISYEDVIYKLLSDIQGAKTNGLLTDVTPNKEIVAILTTKNKG